MNFRWLIGTFSPWLGTGLWLGLNAWWFRGTNWPEYFQLRAGAWVLLLGLILWLWSHKFTASQLALMKPAKTRLLSEIQGQPGGGPETWKSGYSAFRLLPLAMALFCGLVVSMRTPAYSAYLWTGILLLAFLGAMKRQSWSVTGEGAVLQGHRTILAAGQTLAVLWPKDAYSVSLLSRDGRIIPCYYYPNVIRYGNDFGETKRHAERIHEALGVPLLDQHRDYIVVPGPQGPQLNFYSENPVGVGLATLGGMGLLVPIAVVLHGFGLMIVERIVMGRHS